MTEENSTQSALVFPCEFAVKVFGLANDEFEITALTIIRNHVSDLPENAIRSRASQDGKYLALTITFQAESREQLDAIYMELSKNPLVLMAL